jgi:FKBP-type peptidyl-prolyl cis-trans isomerase
VALGSPLPAQGVSVEDNDLPPVGYKTADGLQYYDVREGKGPTPRWGQVAIIHYEGYTRLGQGGRLTLFDDTYTRGEGYLVKHGNGRVIRGLDQGLHSMKLGGLRRIIIPKNLGYTRAGLGPMPINPFRRR